MPILSIFYYISQATTDIHHIQKLGNWYWEDNILSTLQPLKMLLEWEEQSIPQQDCLVGQDIVGVFLKWYTKVKCCQAFREKNLLTNTCAVNFWRYL